MTRVVGHGFVSVVVSVVVSGEHLTVTREGGGGRATRQKALGQLSLNWSWISGEVEEPFLFYKCNNLPRLLTMSVNKGSATGVLNIGVLNILPFKKEEGFYLASNSGKFNRDPEGGGGGTARKGQG